MTDFKIITSHHISGLNDKIKQHLEEGWVVVGSHQVVETHHQNRFRGQQQVDTLIESEYSISLKKEV